MYCETIYIRFIIYYFLIWFDFEVLAEDEHPHVHKVLVFISHKFINNEIYFIIYVQ